MIEALLNNRRVLLAGAWYDIFGWIYRDLFTDGRCFEKSRAW